MNHTYRLVFNAALGTCVPAPETARGAGKGGPAGTRAGAPPAAGNFPGTSLRPLALACVLACGIAPSAFACDASDTASLAACVANAGTDPTINITANITLTGPIGVLPASATIVGNGHTIDGAGTHGGFSVAAGTANVSGLTLVNMGTTQLQGGNLAVGNAGSLGTGSLSMAGGRLTALNTMALTPIDTTFASNTTNTVAAAAGTTLTLTTPTLFNAGTSLRFGTAADTGTVVLNITGGAVASGALFVDGGTLRAGNANLSFVANLMPLTVQAGATLDSSGFALTAQQLNGGGNVITSAAPGNTSTIGTGNFSGVISGADNLEKIGAGTLFLSGNNTYTGTTRISAGSLRVGNGGTTGSLGTNTGAIVNNGSLVFDRADSVLVANQVTGSGALTQAGTGTLILTGANDYSGATTINNGGTLQVGNGGTTGTLGTGSVVNNGSLAFNRSDTYTVGNVISGTGSLTKAGAGTLVLTGANAYTGTTTINAGTLQVGDGGTTGSLGTGNVVNNGALVFNRSDTAVVNNAISGSGSLRQDGGGTLTLVGSNSYTGGTNIAGGTLQIGNGGTTGTLGTGAVTNSASLVFNRSDTYVVNNVISGTGSVTQNGTGTLVLNGANGYLGGTNLNAGTIEVGTSAALGAGPLRFAGGALRATQSHTQSNSLDFAAGSTSSIRAAAGQTFELSGFTRVRTGAQLRFGSATDTGTVVVGAGGGLLEGPFTQQLWVDGGTLRSGGGLLGGLTQSAALTHVASGATLDFAGQNAAIGNLQGLGRVESGSGFLVLDAADFGGVINGTGGLRKATAGTAILHGANTYSGGTLVQQGVLQIGNGGNTGQLGAGDVTISVGGTLRFNRNDTTVIGNLIAGSAGSTLEQSGTGTTVLTGDSSFNGTVNIAAGTLQLGNGGTTGALGGTATYDVAAGATLAFDRSNSVNFANSISGGGRVVQDGTGALTLNGANNHSGGTVLNGGTLVVGNDGALGSGTLTISGGTLASAAPRRITNHIVVNGDFDVFPGGTLPTVSAFQLDGNMDLGGAQRTITNRMDFGQAQFGQLDIGGSISNGGLTLADGGFPAGSSAVFFRFDGSTANTYTGETIVGTNVSLALAKDAGVTAVAGDARVRNESLIVVRNSEQIADTSTVRLEGSGRLTLGTNGAPVTETIGALVDDDSGLGTVVLHAGAGSASRLNVGSGAFSGVISGGAAGTTNLEKRGAGTLVLSGNNTYLGETLVTGGTLQVGAGGTTGTLGTGNVTNNGLLDFNRAGTVTVAGAITGTGLVRQLGPGTLELNGDSNYSGGTGLLAGTLSVGHDNALGTGIFVINDGTTVASTGSRSIANAVLVMGDFAVAPSTVGSLDFTGAVNLGGGARTITNTADGTSFRLYGAVSNGTALIFQDAGLAPGAGTVYFDLAGNAANTYAGETIVGTNVVLALGKDAGVQAVGGDVRVRDGGQLRVRSSEQIADGVAVRLEGNAFLRLGNGAVGITETIGTLLDDGTGNAQIGFLDSSQLHVGNGAFFGTLQSGGDLHKVGAGTLVLAGNNSHFDTVISGGTLQVGNGGSSGTLGTGIVANDGNLVFFRGDTFTVGNDISGTGTLEKAGTGTMILTGNNSYQGTTTISGGTLQVGAGGTVGSLGTGAVVNDGALVFNRSDTLTVGGAISGSGSLTQAGTGTTILAGNNSYQGTTTIAAGTLQVGAGGTAGNLGAGAVTNNGTLVFIRTDSLTVANAISGTGALTHAGTGTTVLAGNNSYAGPTTIAAGTLQVGNGGTTGSLGSGNVTNNGALAFNRSDTVSLANVINGTGSLTQAGSGNLVLTGANTYTGGTFVNAGTLSVNGSIVGNTTVNNGGTLGGTGSVGSVTVANGGTLAPGNSIGTLTANGNLTFAAGSTYRVEANAAGAADRVNTVGAGTITINGGTVDVQAGGAGYQRNTTYTILSSGGATTGQFANATTNLAFLSPTLIYSANGVMLNLQASDALNYASVARTPNQAAVANYLQSFANTPGDAAALIQQIDNMTADQAAASFGSMAGSAHASASQVASALGRNFSATLASRSGFSTGGLGNAMNDWSQVRYASLAPVETSLASAQERGLWAQALGAGGRVDSDGNAAGSRYRNSGLVLGYDQPITGQWLAGGAVGYSTSWWNATSGDPSSGKIESPQAGLYARYTNDSVRVRLDGTFSSHDFTTDRTVNLAGVGATANSKHKGREWGLGAQVEMPIKAGEWEVRPLAGLRYAHLNEDGFSETGQSPANLAVAERTTQNTLLSAGMHFVRPFNQGKAGLELRAVASHLAGDNDSPVTASLIGQPGSFTATGVPLKRNALTLGTTVSGQFTRNVSAYLDANYEVRGSGQDAYQFTGGVRVAF